MIPNQFVQDLLARTDIAEIVGAHVTLRKTGANLSGLCPFHNEKSPSFSVSPTKQFYHCFGCGVSGSALGFLMEYSGYAFPEAVEELARRVGVSVPKETRDSRFTPEQTAQLADHRGQLLSHHALAAQYYKTQLKQNTRAIDYLKRRGLSGEIAAKYGLGYSPDEWQGLASVAKDYDKATWADAGLVIDKSVENTSSNDGQSQQKSRRYDRFRDRIMFPIRSSRGEIIGFGGRIIDQGEPKYLNSPETPLFNKGQELYGLGEARVAIRAAGFALVTEGYMDVVALAQLGFPQAVATLGTAVGAAHVQKLFRYTDHIVFSFDGDAAGRKAAWRALEESIPFITDTRKASFLFLPAEHDPDSFIREQGAVEFEHAIQHALPLTKYLLNELFKRNDVSSEEGKAAFFAETDKLLKNIKSERMLRLIIQGIARPMGMNPREVEVELKQGFLKNSNNKNDTNVKKNKPPLKAELDGSIKRLNPRVNKLEIKKSTGTPENQDSSSKLLGKILLQVPEQYPACEPWLNRWKADLTRPNHDDQTLIYLCNEIQFVCSSHSATDAPTLSRYLYTQVEQGVKSNLPDWLKETMRNDTPPVDGDAVRLVAGIRAKQLLLLCNAAAAVAMASPENMKRFHNLNEEYKLAKSLTQAPTVQTTA